MLNKKIIACLTIIFGSLVSLSVFAFAEIGRLKKKELVSSTYSRYYSVVCQWLFNSKHNISCVDFLKKQHYTKIAIYGMGTLSALFVDELEKSEIEIAYAIDKNAGKLSQEMIPVVFPEDIKNMESVDAIIVTAIMHFDEINKVLRKNGASCNIVSLEGVIMDI